MVLRGSGELELPDANVPIDTETFVRVGAATRRRVRSGAEGVRLLVMGGMPGDVYRPQANSQLGGPETLAATARSSMLV